MTKYYEKNKAAILLRKKAAYKIKVEKHKEDVIASVSHLSTNLGGTKPTLSGLKQALKKYLGQNVVVQYQVPGHLTKSQNYLVPQNGFNQFWKSLSVDFMHNSDHSVFEEYDQYPNGSLIIYPANVKRNDKKLILQHFRDGVNHCVLHPILTWAEMKKNEKLSDEEKTPAQQKKAARYYTTIINKINVYLTEYDDGIPEDKLQLICDDLHVDIHICMPFPTKQGKFEPFLSILSIKKAIKTFKFVNTKLNHVESLDLESCQSFDKLVLTSNVKHISQEEMAQLQEQLESDNEFYLHTKGMQSVSSITTLKGKFCTETLFREIADKFELESGLVNCKLDDFRDPEVCKFIKMGTHYNVCVDFRKVKSLSNDVIYSAASYENIDRKKSYFNYKANSFYRGFAGKITDFRKTSSVVAVGLYMITDLDFSKANRKFVKIAKVLNIYKNFNVWPSPELEMLTNFGVQYKILGGCWGVESIDFDMPEIMMEKENGIPHYSKWVGSVDQHRTEASTWVKMDNELYDYFQNNKIEKNEYWSDVTSRINRFEDGHVRIAYPKTSNYHLGHITAFIVAYQRIAVIEQLMAMKFENIIRVASDGIYHDQIETIELKNVFRHTESKRFIMEASATEYCDQIFNTDSHPFQFPEFKPVNARQVHVGCGGGGKTHNQVTDKGNVGMMYYGHSWKLARAKAEEYKDSKLQTSIHFNLLQMPHKLELNQKSHNVWVIDECSTLTDENKEFLFANSKGIKVIFCGDVGYQLEPIEGKEMTLTGFDLVQEHNVNRRAADCPRLLEILAESRNIIKRGYKQEMYNFYMREFEALGRCISIEDMDYDVLDMIIVRTHDIKNLYTDKFEEQCAELQKFSVTKGDARDFSKGDIIIAEKKPQFCKTEIRHGFTSHSLQGETAKHKLFVDVSRMNYCPRMLYTCLSRAKSIDQIYLITNNGLPDPTIKGIIYKLTATETGACYVGFTTKLLSDRIKQHEADAIRWTKTRKGKKCTSINIINQPFTSEVISGGVYYNDAELRAKELEIIGQTANVVNILGKRKL